MSIGVRALEHAAWEQQCAEQRTRLVGLCRRITADGDSAEDLAQDALLEAWRLRDRLTDPAGFDRWLSAIARNVCMRWMHSRGRARQVQSTGDQPDVMDVTDDWDLEVELERSKLAILLDRALALLPPETRAGLVARHFEVHAVVRERGAPERPDPCSSRS